MLSHLLESFESEKQRKVLFKRIPSPVCEPGIFYLSLLFCTLTVEQLLVQNILFVVLSSSARWVWSTTIKLFHCPLSKQWSAVNKSQQHQEKISWERRELNPGPLGVKRECCPLCYAAPLQNIVLRCNKYNCVNFIERCCIFFIGCLFLYPISKT